MEGGTTLSSLLGLKFSPSSGEGKVKLFTHLEGIRGSKAESLLNSVCWFQVKFNVSIENIFLEVVSCHQKYTNL